MAGVRVCIGTVAAIFVMRLVGRPEAAAVALVKITIPRSGMMVYATRV
jgi:hypothetical protein